MNRYAIINAGFVENIAIADAPLSSNWIPLVGIMVQPGIGWGYGSGIGGGGGGAVFSAPEIPEVPPPAPIRIISKLAYMNRFTDTELAGIYTAAKSNVQVEVWLEKFKLAGEIDLDDPRTIAGLNDVEQAGLIGAGRAGEILA